MSGTPRRDLRTEALRMLPLAAVLVAGTVLGAVGVTALGGDPRPDVASSSDPLPAASPSPGRALAPVVPRAGGPSSRATAPADGEDRSDGDDTSRPQGPPARGTGPAATALPTGTRVTCPSPSTRVSTAQELQAALDAARPGTVIGLADGTYSGAFVARTSGTPDQPVWLCGGRGAVLEGEGVSSGYALHLAPAEHWRVVGFTVRNAQKGVMTDGTTGTRIQDLLVEDIGDEAVHLRSGSTGNVVQGSTIRRTGLRRDKFGEGVYVGSAVSNWSTYGDGGPDRSDFNLVQDNDISSTGAESVDLKEGTTGGAVIGNRFDGTGMTGADSWVDAKGNDWTIQGNTGRGAGKDGFQTHQIVDGWGTGNVFRENTALERGDGVDVYVHKPKDTRNPVLCSNRGPDGGPASSNVDCTPDPQG